MYRVFIALLLALVAVQVSGCTGSLRLGSSISIEETPLATSHA